MHVLVRRPGQTTSRLLGVSAHGTWMDPTDGARAELGSGWWALPGLADSHAHLAGDGLELGPGQAGGIRHRAFACLRAGTFLVIDKGWRDDSVIATVGDAAPAETPDMEGAGRMIAVEDGYFPGFAVETDVSGLQAVVKAAVEEGKGWVKLVGDWPRKGRGAVANFSPEALQTAVQVAHAGGARVAIHTMAPDVASWAVWAGVDSIEHGLFLTMADLEDLGSRSGAWVPTVLRMETTVEMLGRSSGGGRLISSALESMEELLRDVPEDVSVLAGTDLAIPSSRVGEEAVALTRRGLAPARAVDAASVAARRYLGRSDGFIVGEPADAVFFGSDPCSDVSALEEPVAVLRAGRRLR